MRCQEGSPEAFRLHVGQQYGTWHPIRRQAARMYEDLLVSVALRRGQHCAIGMLPAGNHLVAVLPLLLCAFMTSVSVQQLVMAQWTPLLSSSWNGSVADSCGAVVHVVGQSRHCIVQVLVPVCAASSR